MNTARKSDGTEARPAISAKRGLYHVWFAIFRERVGMVQEGDFILESDIPWDLQSALDLKAICKREAYITSNLDESHHVQLRSITRLDGPGAYGG